MRSQRLQDRIRSPRADLVGGRFDRVRIVGHVDGEHPAGCVQRGSTELLGRRLGVDRGRCEDQRHLAESRHTRRRGDHEVHLPRALMELVDDDRTRCRCFGQHAQRNARCAEQDASAFTGSIREAHATAEVAAGGLAAFRRQEVRQRVARDAARFDHQDQAGEALGEPDRDSRGLAGAGLRRDHETVRSLEAMLERIANLVDRQGHSPSLAAAEPSHRRTQHRSPASSSPPARDCSFLLLPPDSRRADAALQPEAWRRLTRRLPGWPPRRLG